MASPSRGLIRAIRWYQRDLSPGRAASCRYLPTCSEYGVQALEQHGLVKGGAKTAWRLLRCNPLSHGGYDPAFPDEDTIDDRLGDSLDPQPQGSERRDMVFHVKHRTSEASR